MKTMCPDIWNVAGAASPLRRGVETTGHGDCDRPRDAISMNIVAKFHVSA